MAGLGPGPPPPKSGTELGTDFVDSRDAENLQGVAVPMQW